MYWKEAIDGAVISGCAALAVYSAVSGNAALAAAWTFVAVLNAIGTLYRWHSQ